MMQMDRPGFSLCAAPLESSGPFKVTQSEPQRKKKSRVFQTGESRGKLSEQEETKLSWKLSQKLSRYSN